MPVNIAMRFISFLPMLEHVLYMLRSAVLLVLPTPGNAKAKRSFSSALRPLGLTGSWACLGGLGFLRFFDTTRPLRLRSGQATEHDT